MSEKRRMLLIDGNKEYQKPPENTSSNAENGHEVGDQNRVLFEQKWTAFLLALTVVQGFTCMFIVDGVMLSLTNLDLLEVSEMQPWLQTSGFSQNVLFLSTAMLAALLSQLFGCGIVYISGIMIAALGLCFAGYILEIDEGKSVQHSSPLLGLGMSFAFVSSILTIRSSGQAIAAGLGRVLARVVFPDIVSRLVNELGWSNTYLALGGITSSCLIYGLTLHMQDGGKHRLVAMKIVEKIEEQKKCNIIRTLGKLLIISISHSFAFTGINILLVEQYYSTEEEKHYLAFGFVLGGLGGLIFAVTGCRKSWFNPLVLRFNDVIFAVPLAFLYALPPFPYLTAFLFIYFGFIFALYISLHVPVIKTILGPELVPFGFGIIFTCSGLCQKVLNLIVTFSKVLSSNPVLMFWFAALFYSVAVWMSEKRQVEELESPSAGSLNRSFKRTYGSFMLRSKLPQNVAIVV